MKELAFLFWFITGVATATLVSYLGYWLQVHGIAVLWLVLIVAVLLFLIWSVATAASAKAQAGLEFKALDWIQAALPALACLLIILICNGVALWLAI